MILKGQGNMDKVEWNRIDSFSKVLLSNLSHKRDRTVQYRTALHVTVFKKRLSLHCSLHLSLHLPLLFTPLQGPLH